MSDVQNQPLPDPGPGDGMHEGDDWEVGVHAAEPDGVGVDSKTDDTREKNETTQSTTRSTTEEQ